MEFPGTTIKEVRESQMTCGKFRNEIWCSKSKYFAWDLTLATAEKGRCIEAVVVDALIQADTDMKALVAGPLPPIIYIIRDK